MTVAIRRIVAHEWSDVHQLLQSTPMSASLPLVIARSTDQSLAHPALSGKSITLGAWRGRMLLGCVHAQIEARQMYVEGRLIPRRVAFVGDVRVAHEARRTGLGLQLIAAVRDAAAELGVHAGFCLVNEGNESILNLLFSGHLGLKTKRVRTYETATRLLLRRHLPPRRPTLLPFEPDTAAIEALGEELANRFLAPTIQADHFGAFLQRYPELRFYRRADGPSRIVCALWDPSRARQFLLKSMPPKLWIMRSMWTMLRPLTRAHPFPRAGQAWRGAEVSFAVREHLPSDFEETLAADAWALGCHTFNWIESGLDQAPLRLRGPAHRMRTHLIGFTIQEPEPPSCPESTSVHVDLGFM